MSNLTLRLIFGAIYVSIMIVAVVFGNPYFVGLLGLICFFAENELAVLAGKKGTQYIFMLPFLLGGIIVYLNLTESKALEPFHFIVALALQWLSIGLIFFKLFVHFKLVKNKSKICFPLFSMRAYPCAKLQVIF